LQSSYGTPVACTAGIPLTNNPDFASGQNIIDQRKATGTPYRNTSTGMEYQQGTKFPTTTFEFDVNPDSVFPILWTLFQKTSFQDADPFAKYYIPYDQSVCEVWLTLVKYMGAGAVSHRISDAICNSITFTCEEGQPLKVSASFIGAVYETNRDGSSDTFTFPAVAPLLFQNATFDLDNTAVNMPSYSITISNNARVIPYDAQTGTKIVLGDLEVTGTFRVPWAQTTEGANEWINNHVAGTAGRVSIWWGTMTKAQEIANADNEFSIISNFKTTSAQIVGEDESLIEVQFAGCSSYSSNSVSTTTTMATGGAGHDTLTASGAGAALSTNFKYGDIFRLLGADTASNQRNRMLKTVTSTTQGTVYPAFSKDETGLNYQVWTTPVTITLCDGVSQGTPNMTTY
jgi:hypothetical protein